MEPRSTFPPILAARRVSVPAFDEAVRDAALGKLGAADVLWSVDAGRAELAIVLEPEVAASTAIEVAAVMFLAVADSLGALMPPQTSVFLRWPRTLLLNVGEVGRVSIALDSSEADLAPDWLVVAASLQVASLADRREPGELVDRTSLVEEGAGEMEPETLLHAIAAHFLVRLDHWQQHGLAAIERQFAERIEGIDAPVLIRHGDDGFVGRVNGIEPGMVLSVAPVLGQKRRLRLRDVLAGETNEAARPA